MAAALTIVSSAGASAQEAPRGTTNLPATVPAQPDPQTVTAPAGTPGEQASDIAGTLDDGGNDVVVTGIRASLAKSLQAKRSADSIVDVITTEDVGKFPDQNIAEALQRVPGVSIDRQAGEGRFASVNGLGPDFVSVLVNGRAIANDNPDRSFSFDTLASEVIGTVKVYKSANAVVPEGGIGGTIDIVTARPFDFKGFTFNGKVGGLYEENSKKPSPQASFLISDKFLDGRLGILASFNYFERRNRTYRVQNSAIVPNVFFDFNSYAYVADDIEDAFRMQDLERAVDDQKRRRIGGTVALQFQATDNLLLTADYLYSNLKTSQNSNSTLNYFYAVKDSPSNVLDKNGFYTVIDHYVDRNISGYSFINQQMYRPVTTNAGGLNAAWKVSDTLTATADLSGSRTINNNRGLDRLYITEALGQGGFLVKSDGGVPTLEGPNLFVPSTTNVSALRARITSNDGTYVKSENWQARGDLAYVPNDAVTINVGGSFASQRKQNEFWQTPNAIRRLYHGNATGEPIDTASIVTGINRPGDVFGNSALSGDMFLINGDALRRWMADPVNIANRTRNATAGGLQEFIANGRSWDATQTGNSYTIREQVASGYFDLHLKQDLFGRPFEAVAGLRYTHTDLTSTGSTRILLDLVDGNENAGILAPVYATSNLQTVSVKNRYDNFLPSINLRWDPLKSVTLRVGAAQTLTRPLLENLAPQISYRALFEYARFAVGSNPNLKPFRSFNIDASAEWYYAKASGVSVAYFHKDINDYIVETVAPEIIPSITNPAYREFQITRPRNAEKAYVEGVTGQWLQTFAFGGGFQINYTKVKGDVSSKSDPTLNFQLPGVSDTANVVGFFERGIVGLRVAYNWRDSFLAQPNYGGYTEPRYFAPFSQVDARLSLRLPGDVGLAFDAINITGNTVSSYGRDKNAFISYQDYGRRFTLSASKRF
jgi:iron complex outermembrane receptor protein